MKYYLDTCIWLNLFKQEGDSSKGIPYWKIAKRFIEKVKISNDVIVISPIILKELSFKLADKYYLAKNFFDNEDYICLIGTTPEDYAFARDLESQLKYAISFLDCLHIAIVKRLNSILITRDKELIRFGSNHIQAKKPEQLFN